MCGGSDVTYTYDTKHIGLNLHRMVVHGDGKYVRTEIYDTLERRPVCWGRSTYSRDLTAEDIDLTQLTDAHPKALELIENRAEFMKRRALEADEERVREEQRANRGCTLL